MAEFMHVRPSVASVEQRVAAIDAESDERGLKPVGAVEQLEHSADEVWVPRNGARVVARAWADPPSATNSAAVMQRAALLPLTLATVLLTACAAMGTRYAEHPIGTAAVAAGQARLVVYRQANTLQYSVREARLELDGSAVGGLLPAGFRAFDVPAGPHRIVVDMWDAPGRCELKAELQGATTHYFEVAPRLESWLAGAPAVAAPPVPAGGLVGGAMMIGGMAIESAGKACGGAFAIVAVDAAVAQPTLIGLRDSQ